MISNRCLYALKATLELALSESGELVTIGQIAEAQDIPPRFLEAILVQLKQSGYAQSVRGKEGGYRLAKPARSITVGEIVSLFEGPLIAPRSTQAAAGRRQRTAGDIFSPIWADAEKTLDTVFRKTQFADLAERTRVQNTRAGADFVI
jgi:Rrf2 family transcriptional regulator, cysteine metabolism repressor